MHLNPVRANMVEKPEEYKWSSYSMFIGEKEEKLINADVVLKYFKPDIFIMCEDAKTKGESFISSPKIIFEVVSKNYAQVDYITKLQVHQKFGVLEYNIVEQNGHIVQYALEDGVYGIKNTFHLGDIYISTIFSDLKIDLSYIYE